MAADSANGTGRTLSVTELELAFAQNPESSAFVDLCVAYLEQGRFMEAMVVCKKGVKAHPDSVEARVLLARVYAEQKKYTKALQELDELVAAKPEAGAAFAARGRIRLESKDEAGGVADLKKAIDLDPSAEQAKKLLLDRGIEYPEKPKVPDPPPPPPAPLAPVMPAAMPLIMPSGTIPALRGQEGVVVTPFVTGLGTLPPGALAPLSRGTGTGDLPPAPDSAVGSAAPAENVPRSRGMSVVPVMIQTAPGAPPQVALQLQHTRQRVEGEDELEEIAQRVAAEKPTQGKPKTSLYLAVALAVLTVSVVGYRFYNKAKIEAIDRLTLEAQSAFANDTYSAYKTAASAYEEILQRHDSGHAATLGRLAHTYAILWAEHGEAELKGKLDTVLGKAEARAPDVAHTWAAKGLSLLYEGKDRPANALKVQAALSPIVDKVKELNGAPSFADLTLALADLELGNYDAATQALGTVKQVLPTNVRAKVLHARAAYRAGRFGTAEASFTEALRAQPKHPGARAGLALVKVVRGDLNGAAENLLKFNELPEKEVSNRDRGLAEFARSQVFRAAGETEKANGAYRIAADYDPNNADFPYGLGKWLFENNREKEALPYLQKAVELEKTRVPFLIALADAEMAADDYKAADQHVEEALRRAGASNLEAAMLKARRLRRAKSPETAAYLERLLKDFPSAEADVQLEYGRLYRAEGKLDEAKKALELAQEKMTGSSPAKQAEIMISYARVARDRSEREPALEAFKRAAALGNLEASYWIAEMLAKGSKEERDEAKKACERYLEAGSSLRYSGEARALCDGLK